MSGKTRRYFAFTGAVALDLLLILLEVALVVVLVAVQFFILLFTVYQTAVSLLGILARRREPPVTSNKKNRFALVVAAHNEEEVVGDIVENLIENMLYPKSHYDEYVICDNCTDRTADVVRLHGGTAMERNDPERKGKGYGLEWMFAKLWEMEGQGVYYDAVAMFDADNLVSPNFLRSMNEKLNQGYEVVQGYLDTKNPSDSWVTKSYAFAYWSTNQIFQLARERLGLSAQLGGTGVVVTTRVLKDIGWGATSLTEDLEFTARYILKTGKRVAWAHNAKIYDEKPLHFKQTWKQRIHWMAGHSDCLMRYGLPLFKMAFRKRSMIAFDAAIYLTQPGRTLLSLTSIAFFIMAAFGSVFNYEYLFISRWVWFAVITVYFAMPIAGLLLEHKGRAILWYFPTYIFSLTWLPVTILGFIRRKERTWNSTKHARRMSRDETARLLQETSKQK